MSKYTPTNVVGLRNDLVTLVDHFVEGFPFKPSLCNELIRTFDKVDEIHTSYEQTIDIVKNFLNCNPPGYINNLAVLESKDKFTNSQQAVLVRFINICHPDRYIIVLNGEVIYVPHAYREVSKEEFGRYVKLNLLDFKDKAKSKTIRLMKSDARRAVSDLIKPTKSSTVNVVDISSTKTLVVKTTVPA